eukprot:bmy_17119T0
MARLTSGRHQPLPPAPAWQPRGRGLCLLGACQALAPDTFPRQAVWDTAAALNRSAEPSLQSLERQLAARPEPLRAVQRLQGLLETLLGYTAAIPFWRNPAVSLEALAEQVDLYDWYRWLGYLGLLLLDVAICLLVLVGLIRSSKGILVGVCLLGVLALIISWGALGLELAVSVGSSDFCVDPDPYVARMVEEHSVLSGDILQYYLACSPRAANPFQQAAPAIPVGQSRLSGGGGRSPGMPHGSRGPVPALWNKWMDVVTVECEGKPCSPLPVIPRNCVALWGPQDCLSALKTLYFHRVASGERCPTGPQSRLPGTAIPPHELVASQAGRPLGRQKPKALELACAVCGWGPRGGGDGCPTPAGISRPLCEQKLSGSHKALVEMQDVVAELLKTVPREHPAAKDPLLRVQEVLNGTEVNLQHLTALVDCRSLHLDGEEEAAPGPRQAHDSLYRVHMPSLYSCGSSYGSETSIPAAAHTVSNAPVTEYMSQNANFQNPRCENTPLIGRESPPPSYTSSMRAKYLATSQPRPNSSSSGH